MRDASEDGFDDGEQPTCDVGGTVMRTVDGGYQCCGCGYEVHIPWVERPTDADDVPGVRGG